MPPSRFGRGAFYLYCRGDPGAQKNPLPRGEGGPEGVGRGMRAVIYKFVQRNRPIPGVVSGTPAVLRRRAIRESPLRCDKDPPPKYVILSDRRESKDLRITGTAMYKSVRRSFDYGLRPRSG